MTLLQNNMKLLLASNSPRRRELLSLLDVDYEVIKPRDIDEVFPASLPASEVAPYLSSLKADAYIGVPKTDEVIVTADTVVICESKILGKPSDERQAIDMLATLSGATHEVVTGVTLMSAEKKITFAETTQVTFDTLSPEIIARYVDRYKPFDKAGAYGIQEWIGCIGISHINGCYYNVMGLPLHALYKRLAEF